MDFERLFKAVALVASGIGFVWLIIWFAGAFTAVWFSLMGLLLLSLVVAIVYQVIR